MPNFYNIIRAKKFSTTADTAVEIGPSTSATPNFAIDAGGKLKWSSGSAVADANLYRTAANALKTDGSIEITTGLTAATPSFTGPLTSTGAANFSSSVTVAGDLTVNGTTTTINATTISVDDINIELGSSATPTVTTANGGGITLKGDTDKTIIWNNAASPSWNLSENLNLASGKTFKIDDTDVLTSNSVFPTSNSISYIGGYSGITKVMGGLAIKQVQEYIVTDGITNLSSSATNIDVLNGSIYHFTGTPSANFDINIRGDSTFTNLNDVLATGYTMTITIIVDRAANTYRLSTVNINGSSQTINWFGGTAPSAGNALDIYSITVLKTGSSTYKVFASQAKFA